MFIEFNVAFFVMCNSERRGVFTNWANHYSSWYNLMICWLCCQRHL